MIEFIQSLYSNPVFSGMVGGSFVVSLLFLVKWVPGALFKLLIWRWTSRVTIHSDDLMYEAVNDWLSGLDYAKVSRNLQLDTQSRGEDEKVIYSPGLGRHFIRLKGRFVAVIRDTPREAVRGWRKNETITIIVLGLTVTGLHELIEELVVHRAGHHRGVDVYLYKEYWRRVCRRAKRPLDTIFLPEGQKQGVIKDIERFLASQQWYEQRGIPYRRGYLLEGPPGTGKTSLVMSLAAYFNRPVYTLNLGSLGGDDDLINAVTSAPPYCILLIEDIDATATTAAREKNMVVTTPGIVPVKQPTPLSLSGLLNSLDGSFSRDGRILFMTTNHPDKVDEALIRSGRVDRREHIGLLATEDARIMCRAYLDDVSAERVLKTLELPIAPAELQRILIREVA